MPLRRECLHHNQQSLRSRSLFLLQAKSLPDNPYDGHTLRDVIDLIETLTGSAIERVYADKGYRGHGAKNPPRL